MLEIRNKAKLQDARHRYAKNRRSAGHPESNENAGRRLDPDKFTAFKTTKMAFQTPTLSHAFL